MIVPEDLRYTENHEWLRLNDDGTVVIGITDFAQDALGDVVFVDLPDAGRTLESGEPFGEVESTKSVSDVYVPFAGEVVDANMALEDTPELVNADPYGEGWFIVFRPLDVAGLNSLMDSEGYQSHIAE